MTFKRRKDKELISSQCANHISKFYAHSNQEILNSFAWFNERSISIGPIESRNSSIKLHIKNTAGHRNVDHLNRYIYYYLVNKQRPKH